jgi:methylenetetrahydrofolate reductase (NADPH)
MRVVDLIKSTDNTAFSFEILPPLKGTGIEKLYKTVDTLREFDPKYINITTHRSEYVYKELGNGLYQRTRAAVPEQLLLPPLCRTNTI